MRTIRILHSLARSGCTIVSKCFGCMDDLILLSEIHPKGVEITLNAFGQESVALYFSPIAQAYVWHQLLDYRLYKDQIFNTTDDQFLQQIIDIETATQTQNKQLLIRDWSYIDFVGFPFCNPVNIDTLSALLSRSFKLKHVSLIRDPIDQWLSMSKAKVFQSVSLEQFLEGYLNFLKAHPTTTFFKYEYFTENPECFLQECASAFGIEYDDTWQDKWSNFTKVTGDRSAKSSEVKEIFHHPYKKIDSELSKKFCKSPFYEEILSITHYSPR